MANEDQPDINLIYTRALRIWSAALLTPIFYLGIAWAAEQWEWITRDTPHPFDTPFVRGMMIGFGAALIAIAALWRWRRQTRVRKLRDDPGRALASWKMDFFIVASIADMLGFLGLIGFIVTGLRIAVLIGGAAAYAGYAAAYPLKSELKGLRTED